MTPEEALLGAAAGPTTLPRYTGSGGNRLGQALGEILSGGGGSTPAYSQAMSRGSAAYKQLAEAKIKTDELNARERAQESIRALYPEGDPRGAAFADATAAGYGNLDQVTQSDVNITKGNLLRKAADEALGGGDMGAINDLLTVYQGQPRKRTDVQGNTIIDPYGPTDQTTRMTDYGAAQAGSAATRAEAALTNANRPRGTGGRSADPAQAAEQAIKIAARDALYSARAEGQDLYGVNIGDIEHAFRTNGEWRNPNDTKKVVKFSATAEDKGEAPTEIHADGTPVSAPVTAPKNPKAPAAGTPARNVSQRIQDARDALAAGADPAKVRARMLQVGLNPAAAGL